MTDEQEPEINRQFATSQWATSRQLPRWKHSYFTEEDEYPFNCSFLPTDTYSIPIDFDTHFQDQGHSPGYSTSHVTGPRSACILDEARWNQCESSRNSSISKQCVHPIPPTFKMDTGNTHIGRWSKREHELFLQGLKLYGKSWKKIAKLVSTRTLVQIRTHAQKYLQKQQRAAQKKMICDEKGDRKQVESWSLNDRDIELDFCSQEGKMEIAPCESRGLDEMSHEEEDAAMRDDVIECLLCPSPKRGQASREMERPMLLNESVYWEISTPREANRHPKSFVTSTITRSSEAFWVESAADRSIFQWNSQHDDAFSEVFAWQFSKEHGDTD
uniref:Uncharacterized protein AlNc14C78G5174 n=1 Tax=Albugo laibachii Nc14 TaxID=890382 RepID=F0WEX6_9STRA|nr:conserved hypothetical protein [Albugo laibachii Nc14]|eukprot:CCA19758.1 conserved hypothetical protein [Albugo laibachii Nc14]